MAIIIEDAAYINSPEELPAPQPQDADSAVREKLAQLAPGFSPGALNTYLPEFMFLLLDHHVTSEIIRDTYLEELRRALSEKKLAKVTLRQLKAEFDRAVADRAGPGATPDAGAGSPQAAEGVIPVCTMLDGAPVAPEAVIPPGWVLNADGVFKPRGPRAERVLSAPLVLTGRLLDVGDAAESLELCWFRDNRWKRKVANRTCLANKTKLLDLALDGLPVNSNNAADAVQFIADYEAANLGLLPPTQVAHALGWIDGRTAFLCGHTLIREPAAPASATVNPFTTGFDSAGLSGLPVVFQGRDVGDEQIAHGFHGKGTFDGWRAAVESLLHHPKFRLAVIASLCSPLLEVVEVPNPIVEFVGDTSHGKTACLRGAASVWGSPNEKTFHAAIGTWDVTSVGVERYLTTVNNLPLILDDTSLCKSPDLIGQVVYNVVAGRGRTRGSLTGTQRVGTWSTVLLSSGESSVNSHAERGGARARVLTLYGSPFGEVSGAMGQAVKRLNDGVMEHYGHAGPRFVQFLLANRGSWSRWKLWHRRIMQIYAAKAGNNPVAGRMADVFATLDLTGILAGRALDMRQLKRSPVKALWRELADEAGRADIPTRALRHLYHWARMHENEFHGRGDPAPSDKGPQRVQPLGGWAGRWETEGSVWEYIAFFPPKITEVLREAGFDADAMLRAWQTRGWLHRDAEGKNPQVRIGRERQRMVAVTRQAMETLEGGPSSEETPPWLDDAARRFLSTVVYKDANGALPTTRAECAVIRQSVTEAVQKFVNRNDPVTKPLVGQDSGTQT